MNMCCLQEKERMTLKAVQSSAGLLPPPCSLRGQIWGSGPPPWFQRAGLPPGAKEMGLPSWWAWRTEHQAKEDYSQGLKCIGICPGTNRSFEAGLFTTNIIVLVEEKLIFECPQECIIYFRETGSPRHSQNSQLHLATRDLK